MTVLRSIGGFFIGCIAVALILVISPILIMLFVWWLFRYLVLSIQLRASLTGKIGILAYTESDVWTPYLEQRIIPEIEADFVVINRSREDWKRRFPLEHKAIDFWGNDGRDNPLGLLIEPGLRVRVFRFYESFKDYKHGKEEQLSELVDTFLGKVREIRA